MSRPAFDSFILTVLLAAKSNPKLPSVPNTAADAVAPENGIAVPAASLSPTKSVVLLLFSVANDAPVVTPVALNPSPATVVVNFPLLVTAPAFHTPVVIVPTSFVVPVRATDVDELIAPDTVIVPVKLAALLIVWPL